MKISAPCHLEEQHNLEPFSCGEMVLDDWLKTRSRKNEASGASRTYVITRANDVVGYYSLAVGSVSHMLVPGKIRRNMPDPIPVMLLARLAVDTSIQGKGMGRALLRDAILRTEQAAHIAGIRAMLVHALHERAKVFYRGCGFTPSPINELTLMLPMPFRGKRVVDKTAEPMKSFSVTPPFREGQSARPLSVGCGVSRRTGRLWIETSRV